MHHYQILEKGKLVSQAQKALILIHGRGASAESIISLADEFCDETFYIAAPQATNSTWYPYGFMEKESANEPWLSSAVAIIQRLIDETAKHIPIENMYIIGFSQGACLTIEVTARFATRYGGIAAFTGGLIGEKTNAAKYKGDFKGTKYFLGNSDKDPHVPVHRSEESKHVLTALGADVRLKVYPNMAHTINQDEIETVRNWILNSEL